MWNKSCHKTTTLAGRKPMVKVFSKVGQTSRSRSRGQKLRYHVKGLVTRNTHVQCESSISSGNKGMAKVKVFRKYAKLQGQGHEVKNYGTMWEVLSQGIHMCNMKGLSLLIRKLWPMLKFFKSRSNFKVKVMRSNYGTMWKVLSQGIHMCNMKDLSSPVIKLWPRLKFLFTHHTPTPTRTPTLGLWH